MKKPNFKNIPFKRIPITIGSKTDGKTTISTTPEGIDIQNFYDKESIKDLEDFDFVSVIKLRDADKKGIRLCIG